MAFPEGFVEEVRQSADIVRFISDHIGLRKAGTSWKGLCPFHNEKTPSFNVRTEPAVFHCFGCGEGGDVFKFVMLKERVPFPEAVEIVARRFGVTVPERRVELGPERKLKEELLGVLEAAARHFETQLWTAAGTTAREYLLGRGFKKETLERVRAGAAIDSWSALHDALKPRFPVGAMLNAGLVIERDSAKGKGHYDRFRNRAAFPIFDEAGKVVGFGARSLDGSEPKYLNSPESPVYQKSKVLYGMSWAKEPIRKGGRAVLMEGYLDVARALECGVGEAVATCGTALTPQHTRLLRRFADAVSVNFDQDEAGRKAARRSIDLLLEEGLKATVVELPEGHDPDSFLKAEGAEAYRARLAEAPAYMEWLIRRAAIDHDIGTPEGKAGFLADLLPHLGRVASAVERAAWLEVACDRGRLDPAAAKLEMKRALAQAKGERPAATPAATAPFAPRPAPSVPLLAAERWLVSCVLQETDGVLDALRELEPVEIESLRTADVLRTALELCARGQKVTVAALQEALPDEETRRLVSELAVAGRPESGPAPGECVRELKRRPLQARMAEIQRDLGGATGPRLEALLAEKLQLRRHLAGL